MKNRAGVGLVEIAIAVVILALGVPSLVELARASRHRGLSDETLLAVHLRARNALMQAVDAGRRDGFALSTSSVDEVEVTVAPEESLAGLWRVTATARAAGVKGSTYAISRLVADVRVPAPDAEKEAS